MADEENFDQLRKQKGKGKKAGAKKEDDPQDAKDEGPSSRTADNDQEENTEDTKPVDEDATTEPFPDIREKDETVEQKRPEGASETPLRSIHERQPSLSVQSKMRSSSFRRTSMSHAPISPGANGSKSPDLPLHSPDGDSVNSIYRKQAVRLDELEKENRRLAKEAADAEKKLRQTEEELEELREASVEVLELKSRLQRADAQTEELNKLTQENISLARQISHLQSQIAKRHASSPSQATSTIEPSSLQSVLDSKSSLIESMEMEISTLRAQIANSTTSTSTHTTQVTALEEKLARADRAAAAAQQELGDVKRNLDRASEKAVKEGSERTSAETRIRSLTREAEEAQKAAEESVKRGEVLEKKLAAVTGMHREGDMRRQMGERERERLVKEAGEMRRRLAGVENENLRLREERDRVRKRDVGGGADDEGLDELEDDERSRLESRVRGLEGEIYELRKGAWRERRREMGEEGGGVASPGSNKFDDVDLTGGFSPRRQSVVVGKGSSFSDVLSSGISAFTGGGKRESDLFDEVDFDEDAFRVAQEEEARKRVERVREIKRGLKEWEGWRMDIVDVRVGSGGGGEIFDV